MTPSLDIHHILQFQLDEDYSTKVSLTSSKTSNLCNFIQNQQELDINFYGLLNCTGGNILFQNAIS